MPTALCEGPVRDACAPAEAWKEIHGSETPCFEVFVAASSHCAVVCD